MAYVEPIADKQHIKKAARFIKDNFDPAYALIWQIGIETGYRITDITELKYSDLAIEAAVKLRLLFGKRLRQTEGLLLSIMRLMNLDLPVPDHTTMSRRMKNIKTSSNKKIQKKQKVKNPNHPRPRNKNSVRLPEKTTQGTRRY